MRDLSRATGVSSGTIRFYIQKGILPKPYKTYRNMAHYDESYVDRIRLIKELQDKRYLPLDIIKSILEGKEVTDSSDEVQVFKDVDRPLFKDIRTSNGVIGPLTREELMRQCGLSLSDIQKMESIGMIAADDKGKYDQECVRLAELVAKLRATGLTEEWGFQIENLQIHMDLTEFLSRREVELFTKRIAGKGLRSEEITRLINESINTLNSVIGIIHKRLISKLAEQIS